MGKITIQSAWNEFTQRVLGAMNERKAPSSGFKGFFGEVISGAREVAWEIKRKGRPIAVDVEPHEDGNIRRSNKSTQKIYVPPTFNEAVNVDAFDSFERVFGGRSEVDVPEYVKLVEAVAEDMVDIEDSIERAEELQRAQALLTGIVTMNNGDNITFGRKGASLVAYDAAHDWAIRTVNPGKILQQGAEFMIKEGNAVNNGVFNVIMGANANNAFRANELRQKEGDIKDQMFMDLSVGATQVSGLTPLGSYTYGTYRFNLWGYEGYYDDVDGNTLPFMDTNKIVMIPPNYDFKMFYGGTKAWRGTGQNRFPTVIKAKRNYYKAFDELGVSMLWGVRTAPVALLRSVDNVFTAEVVNPSGGAQG